jgi:hypothetical protein
MIDHGKLLVYDTIGNVTSRFAGGGGNVEIGFARTVDEQTRSRIGSTAGVLSVVPTDNTHLIVKFNPKDVTQDALLESIAAMRAGATSFKETTSGLEDAYLSLIKETL